MLLEMGSFMLIIIVVESGGRMNKKGFTLVEVIMVVVNLMKIQRGLIRI